MSERLREGEEKGREQKGRGGRGHPIFTWIDACVSGCKSLKVSEQWQ